MAKRPNGSRKQIRELKEEIKRMATEAESQGLTATQKDEEITDLKHQLEVLKKDLEHLGEVTRTWEEYAKTVTLPLALVYGPVQLENLVILISRWTGGLEEHDWRRILGTIGEDVYAQACDISRRKPEMAHLVATLLAPLSVTLVEAFPHVPDEEP